MTKRIVVLISGHGRNLQALLDHCTSGHIPARIVGVISNRSDAPGLARAHAAGVGTQVISHGDFASRDLFDGALANAIEQHQPEIVALAGFMRVLGADFIRRFRGRLLNIHPSLLPKYPGLRTHDKVLAAGDREHGASVHFVTEQVDGGPVVVQGRLRVAPQDTAEHLADRVMREIELQIYPQAVAWMARGELRLDDGMVNFRGRPLGNALTLADLEPEFR